MMRAKNGDANAQNGLGAIYYLGYGVKKDDVKAKLWYTKAAKQGNGSAQYSLGMMYQYGKGVKKNLKKAKQLYGEACDHKDQEGCDAYAKMHF